MDKMGIAPLYVAVLIVGAVSIAPAIADEAAADKVPTDQLALVNFGAPGGLLNHVATSTQILSGTGDKLDFTGDHFFGRDQEKHEFNRQAHVNLEHVRHQDPHLRRFLGKSIVKRQGPYPPRVDPPTHYGPPPTTTTTTEPPTTTTTTTTTTTPSLYAVDQVVGTFGASSSVISDASDGTTGTGGCSDCTFSVLPPLPALVYPSLPPPVPLPTPHESEVQSVDQVAGGFLSQNLYQQLYHKYQKRTLGPNVALNQRTKVDLQSPCGATILSVPDHHLSEEPVETGLVVDDRSGPVIRNSGTDCAPAPVVDLRLERPHQPTAPVLSTQSQVFLVQGKEPYPVLRAKQGRRSQTNVRRGSYKFIHTAKQRDGSWQQGEDSVIVPSSEQTGEINQIVVCTVDCYAVEEKIQPPPQPPVEIPSDGRLW
ncbi:uncharacterized protein LOC126576676 [Anopheles aquasalis]|uniref:uncharacterized protein LOC126576676 n=1 Tax=Anopheles aquasalis TaxID=42839 RepID=UPI00215B30BA|nr:uncharacterized protein LOC126576676 [Anopheles aquasalis]